MGRWLKILNDTPKSQLTKPTEVHCVSFVSTSSNGFHKKIDLLDFVTSCLTGLDAHPQQVVDSLLSLEDEQDIINGNTPKESLRLHIELWINADKPHHSKKPLK